jgi:hypothetical protein
VFKKAGVNAEADLRDLVSMYDGQSNYPTSIERNLNTVHSTPFSPTRFWRKRIVPSKSKANHDRNDEHEKANRQEDEQGKYNVKDTFDSEVTRMKTNCVLDWR